MLQAIIFDLDGVLVDSEPLHYHAFVQVARRYGIDFDYAQYLERYVGYDDRDGFRTMFADRVDKGSVGLAMSEMASGTTLSAATDLSEDQVADLCRQKAEAFELAASTEGVTALPGARALVTEASSKNIPMAIATGASRIDAQLLLEHLNLDDYFTLMVTADDVLHSKPHPQTYRMAVQQLAVSQPRLQLQAHRCLAIEDTAPGIEAARAAGLATLGVSTTGPADLLHAANRVIDSLSGVNLNLLRQWFDDSL